MRIQKEETRDKQGDNSKLYCPSTYIGTLSRLCFFVCPNAWYLSPFYFILTLIIMVCVSQNLDCTLINLYLSEPHLDFCLLHHSLAKQFNLFSCSVIRSTLEVASVTCNCLTNATDVPYFFHTELTRAMSNLDYTIYLSN